MTADPTYQNLLGLQPDVVIAAVHLVNAFRAAGYPAIITSGRRTAAHNRSVGGALRSRHLLGRAIDVAFLDRPLDLELLRQGGALWTSWGGRWGGDFSVPDPGHFDA